LLVQLLCCWWSFVFATTGLWPFTKIKGWISRGLVAMVSCWVLGFLTWYIYIAVLGMDSFGMAFPFVANIFFLIAATSFIGENKHVEGLPVHKQLAINMCIWFGFAYLLIASVVTWIPAWWFGILQTFLVTGFMGTLTKGMKQPTKSIVAWAFVAFQVMILAKIGIVLGFWAPGGYQFGTLWMLGVPNIVFFVFFAAWCSFNWSILAPTGLWPFAKISEPWRYIIITAYVLIISWLVTLFALWLFPMYFPPATALWEAFVWVYIPTNWTFLILLLFVPPKPS